MITYYTDGSCSPNPGPGGFAVIKDMQPAILGADKDATNIRMEGKAIIAALKDANGAECQIFSDSEFWINVITKWSLAWEKNGWQKKGGEIKNLDIVQEVCPLYRSSQATLTWVRGHANDPGNQLADEWANIARQRALQDESLELTPLKKPSQAELTEDYLRVGHVMQLATVDDARPIITTVYYVWYVNAFYWLSLPGRRHSQHVVDNPFVAVTIAIKADQPVIGLQAEGKVSVVKDITEIKAVMNLYKKKYNRGETFVKDFMAGTHKDYLYKCSVESLTVFDEQHFSAHKTLFTYTPKDKLS